MRRLLLVLVMLFASATVDAQEVSWAPGASLFVNSIGPSENAAEVEHGIVQPTALESSAVLPALETHAFYNCGFAKCGPFVAITLGDSLVNQIHGGFMFGLTDHFNLGIGYSVKPKGQVLRDDFVLGQPAPNEATAAKYVERSVTGISIVLGVPLP